MFKNLHELIIEQQRKAESFLEKDFKKIILSKQFIQQYGELFESRTDKLYIFENYSKLISSSGLNLIFPNQWYYLAYIASPIVNELKKYKDFVAETLKMNTDSFANFCREAKIGKLNESDKAKLIDGLSDIDSEYIIKFITDYQWWQGGKTIDRGDYFVSPILSSLKLVNVSSSYVADMAAIISKSDIITDGEEKNYFEFIEDNVLNLKEEFKEYLLADLKLADVTVKNYLSKTSSDYLTNLM